MGYHHGTGRAQNLHLAVTCNVTAVIVKTIVIVAYFPLDHKINPKFVIQTSGEDDTDRIL